MLLDTSEPFVACIFVSTWDSTYSCHLSGNGKQRTGITVTAPSHRWTICGMNSPPIVASYE